MSPSPARSAGNPSGGGPGFPVRPFVVAAIVPTGIGAEIGGYAGDALPVVRAIAAIADCTLAHPNLLNGAQLYWPDPSVLYVEGYGLDRLAAGDWALQPTRQNRIGLVLDRALEPDLQLRHLQAADAAKATLGLDVTDAIVTDAPLGVELRQAKSGASWGTVRRLDSLLRAAELAIARAGAEAIAVVARFPDDEGEASDAYRQGRGVDPIAGAEAVISHAIVREFRIPAAHAPALAPWPPSPDVDPRAAAEELGYTFLPCVLAGLSRAPRFVPRDRESGASPGAGGLTAADVDAVVVPYTACGGAAVLGFARHQARIIAVRDNRAVTAVPPEAIGLSALPVNSYLEALGALAAQRAGVVPAALQARTVRTQCWDARARHPPESPGRPPQVPPPGDRRPAT